MKSCFYCGKEFDEYDEPIKGIDSGKLVFACEECTHVQENFVKSKYCFDEIFKKFTIQYITLNNPITIHGDCVIRQTFAEAVEYANENYDEDQLVGIEFDAYVNEHGVELIYSSDCGFWVGFDWSF